MLCRELTYPNIQEVFWTDSKVVQAYIHNDARRFHTYVANRVQQIRDHTKPEQWTYVESENNPADDASRGLSPKNILQSSRWIRGPPILWNHHDSWRNFDDSTRILSLVDDKEIKKSSVLSTVTTEPPAALLKRLAYFSDWFRAKRAIANCLRYVKLLRSKVNKECPEVQGPANHPLTVEELQQAEQVIVKAVQGAAFAKELKDLSVCSNETSKGKSRTKQREIKRTCALYRLDPFIDQLGILRVGGRIRHANVDYELKHPVVLPKEGHVSHLIAKWYHELTKHQGRGLTLNEIRSLGYWIVGCSTVVSKLIHECVTCRKLRASVQEQKMAELPQDRLEPSPPFTYCAVDYFGPWIVKERRKEMKRYGVLFTCLFSRAIHLEVAHSLETDSFINALRRFICRRGPVRQLRSDRGTNFIGARRELKEALSEMNEDAVKGELLRWNCDWIEMKFNVPSASHMGGVWERQIRTVRNVLSALLTSGGGQLNDEALRTFMCEAEAVVNGRPLTVNVLTTPNSLEALTPNHLLTMKSKIILPPPGNFQEADGYSRKCWRRVQHLTNEFWCRWKKEFLQTLQERAKWTRRRRNMQVGDIVIVKDENAPRNCWKMARVTDVFPSSDGLVRKVKVEVGNNNLTAKGSRKEPPSYLERPIQKLVVLLPSAPEERPGVPVEEP